MSLSTISSTCRPRANVEAGSVRDNEFMADLFRVFNRTAPAEYLAKSYPTRGMKELLKAICLRRSGQGGEVASIIRLDTRVAGADPKSGAARTNGSNRN
jgi:predicted AAA+ superfamily ATPase